MDENLQTLESNPGVEQNVPTAEGVQNVTPTPTPPALSLEEINTITKHSYSDINEARKGLENLVSFTGKKIESVPSTPQGIEELQKKVAEMEFYDSHPEYKEFKGFLAKFGNPQQAVSDPEVQKALNAMKTGGAETQTSVLNTNNRIGTPAVSDYQSDLEKAQNTGNWIEFMQKHKGVPLPE